MLDSIHIHSGGESQHHYHRHEVTEHRAPTDKSVQLLREMEIAARDKIDASIRLADSAIDCVVHIQDDFLGNQTRLCALYRLNGERHRVDHIEPYTLDRDHTDRCIVGLRDALARDIANRLLARPFSVAGLKFFRK